MSADNGVYILTTRGQKRGKKEYRVAHCQAIDNLTYQPDYPRHQPQFEQEMAKMLFGKSRVFTDMKLAQGYAMAILDGLDVCEYGMEFIDFPNVRFPS